MSHFSTYRNPHSGKKHYESLCVCTRATGHAYTEAILTACRHYIATNSCSFFVISRGIMTWASWGCSHHRCTLDSLSAFYSERCINHLSPSQLTQGWLECRKGTLFVLQSSNLSVKGSLRCTLQLLWEVTWSKNWWTRVTCNNMSWATRKTTQTFKM